MKYLEQLQKTYGTKSTMGMWAINVAHLLTSALQDIKICLHHFANFVKSSPMTFVVLSNLTKDGFPMRNIYRNPDSSLKNTDDFSRTFPFFHMGRLVQVQTFQCIIPLTLMT